MALPIDVEGPVRAEVFVLFHDGDGIRLSGPCGAGPWHIETGGVDHPLELVERMTRRVLGVVDLLHSTSWRWAADAVVLTFVAVVPPAAVAGLPILDVGRVELARSSATSAPTSIGWEQVLEHGLRHLAWLAEDDSHVRAALSAAWRDSLTRYVPEPFRQIDGGGR